MKKLKIIPFFLLFPIFLSAQKAVHIPMGQNIGNTKELPVSEIAESIRFVPLETNESCFFGENISKVEIVDDMLFVSDYNYIFKYDLNGKFLTRIGKKGRGPGEYAQGPQTFLINKSKRLVILFVLYESKMIEYDFEGNFIKEKTLDFMPGLAEWNDNEDIAVYNMGFTYEKEPWHDLYVLNQDGKTVQKNKFKKQPDKKYGLILYPPILYRYNGKTRYKNPHGNVIYELDEKGKTTPVYVLDYGKYEKYNDIDDVEIQIKNNVGTNRSNPKSFEKIGLLGLSETDDYLFIYYGHQEQRKVGVFDKKNSTFYNLYDSNYELYGFHDDSFGGLPLFPKAGLDRNYFYSYYTAFEFKEYLKKANKLNPELKKLAEGIDENDNPVLMLVKLK
ncbi:MAG: 6-bladed beta-propeller [Prolixibacteraceae bacterium]|nr:6-bladed beta-propeller [Prolixibacteraceae bacterium]